MSKKRFVFTVALVAAMTVGALALTASPAAAGRPCLIPTCAACAPTIIFPNGLICEFDVCIVKPDGCKKCNYTCHF